MKMCNQIRAGVAGFALLETLIAFVVLAIGLLALLSFHNESQQNIGDAKARSEAVAIGEQKLQELQSFLSDGDPRIADGTTGTDVYTGINAVFTRNWKVVTTTSADVNLAQISVQWGDVGTGVELQSEIYKWEPSSSTKNFLEVVKNYSGNAGGPGGNWFGTGTDTGTGADGDGSGDDTGDDGDSGQDDGGDGSTDDGAQVYNCACRHKKGKTYDLLGSTPDDQSSCCSVDGCAENDIANSNQDRSYDYQCVVP